MQEASPAPAPKVTVLGRLDQQCSESWSSSQVVWFSQSLRGGVQRKSTAWVVTQGQGWSWEVALPVANLWRVAGVP